MSLPLSGINKSTSLVPFSRANRRNASLAGVVGTPSGGNTGSGDTIGKEIPFPLVDHIVQFEPVRPEKMLLNIKLYDVSGSIGTRIGGRILLGTGQITPLGVGLSHIYYKNGREGGFIM